MKIEEQVLSMSQIQELIELGFNVRKYSSIYYVPNWEIKWGEYEIQDYHLVIGELREEDIDCIPTLTIGDIIDILPKEIINDDVDYYFTIDQEYVTYSNIYLDGYNVSFLRGNLIDKLFECLKYCIKNNYIKLDKD